MKHKNISSMIGIGENIKKRRKECKITQEDLAEKVGIGLRSLQLYESNQVNPKIETLSAIGEALNCDCYYFVFGKTENELNEEIDSMADLIFNKKLEELDKNINLNSVSKAISKAHKNLNEFETTIQEFKNLINEKEFK